MAIDRVKKATFLVLRKETRRLLHRLHALSAVHVEDAASMLELPEGTLRAEAVSAETADLNLKKLHVINSTFDLVAQEKKGFIEGFAAMPLQVTCDELHHVVSEFDFNPLYDRCAYLSEEYKILQGQIEQAEAEMETLRDMAGLPFTVKQMLSLGRSAAAYGSFSGQNWSVFSSDPECSEMLAWQVVRSSKKEVRVVVVFLKQDADSARELLRKHGFTEITLPKLPGTVEDRLHELEEDIAAFREQQATYREEISRLAADRRRVQIALGYWESEKRKIEVQNYVYTSGRTSVITGWIRVKDLERVQTLLAREFPDVSLVTEDPTPDDDVPVSLSLGWFSRPAETLVRMFGLPDYFSFDPTPYLIFSYLVFFSFCFGDVAYGIGLVAFSFIMARKYRSYGPQVKFFRLFLYAGVGSIIFGAFTGAWAGNIYDERFLGEGNVLYRLAMSIPHIDPLAKPMLMLGAALGLGVANQFYGILLGMYKAFRRGNPAAAIFDNALWLIFLPGVLLLLSPMIVKDAPEGLKNIGTALAGVGAAGLVLTQGRNEKGIIAKAITGIVSLYGVLGTYGITAFIGDVLSYSRLLALGLTTSIVAAAFNDIASMFQGIQVVGVLLFIAVVLLGHTFNFAVSILSAFVHSARLIFLEFFNRFYESGARRFSPLGFNGGRVELVDPDGHGCDGSVFYG